MKPQEEKQRFGEGEAAKPRFKIEKLEARIAPRPGYSGYGGLGHGNGNGGSGGHCGHGACK